MNDENDHRGRRREYAGRPLRRSSLAADPLDQFAEWLKAATGSGANDATAMALATVGRDGAPSVRIVLLKHFDARGLCWYSDDRSRKGADLAANARASAVFYWPDFNRQVRVSGAVEKLAAEASDAYFLSRPIDSRYAAAASIQSAPVDDREVLERAVAELQARYPVDGPPRPPAWGGYRLCPDEFEFWQGRPGRLHDRFVYRVDGGGAWAIRRLQP